MTYKVVTQLTTIAKLNRQLGRTLNQTFRHREVRTVSYPAGNVSDKVRFADGKGDHVPAWASGTHKGNYYNFILFGTPRASAWLEISAQLNFPANKFTRAVGGVFVEDGHGRYFIAHRGKLTRGRAGLKKQEVLAEFSNTKMLIAAEDVNGKTVQLIRICALDDPKLAKRMCEFAELSREVAERVAQAKLTEMTGANNGNGVGGNTAGGGQGGRQSPSLVLRDYFDEYAGQSKTQAHGGGIRKSEHGAIVKALEAEVRVRGQTQKAQAIDLALVLQDAVHLYEVKTAARTTDIYTAVGQLLIHGACIADLIGLPVKRYLVLPAEPRREHARHITAKGRMVVVTYQKRGQGYRFVGL